MFSRFSDKQLLLHLYELMPMKRQNQKHRGEHAEVPASDSQYCSPSQIVVVWLLRML
jgi:hypothetical protein